MKQCHVLCLDMLTFNRRLWVCQEWSWLLAARFSSRSACRNIHALQDRLNLHVYHVRIGRVLVAYERWSHVKNAVTWRPDIDCLSRRRTSVPACQAPQIYHVYIDRLNYEWCVSVLRYFLHTGEWNGASLRTALLNHLVLVHVWSVHVLSTLLCRTVLTCSATAGTCDAPLTFVPLREVSHHGPLLSIATRTDLWPSS